MNIDWLYKASAKFPFIQIGLNEQGFGYWIDVGPGTRVIDVALINNVFTRASHTIAFVSASCSDLWHAQSINCLYITNSVGLCIIYWPCDSQVLKILCVVHWFRCGLHAFELWNILRIYSRMIFNCLRRSIAFFVKYFIELNYHVAILKSLWNF